LKEKFNLLKVEIRENTKTENKTDKMMKPPKDKMIRRTQNKDIK